MIEHALEHFRREGMSYVMIETMAQIEIGHRLYPALGSVEVARRIHFARRFDRACGVAGASLIG
ncbi:MAG TPA: hypothetical protein DCE44_21240 [Verrucomicrobiales bacterium]|nr:hypothetical protein [Verrucomicrobiales bacterium]